MVFDPSLELITVRGHTLLCLQGFRGEGYSPAFVENMTSVHQLLSASPDIPVRVVQKPDQFCAACPNLKSDGCHLHGPGSEEGMKAQDADVMARLGIADGQTLPWREILRRIAEKVEGKDLTEICGSCPWLPLGYCKEGIDRLGEERRDR
jgi:hypothetical protein